MISASRALHMCSNEAYTCGIHDAAMRLTHGYHKRPLYSLIHTLCVWVCRCCIKRVTHMEESSHMHMDESCRMHMDESCHTHMDESCHTHMDESRHTHMDESCHTHMDESCHTHMIESCRTYD